MTINGEKLEYNELKFTQYLQKKGLKAEFIALELNGKIISKDKFDTLIIKKNDKAEVVSFVGGG